MSLLSTSDLIQVTKSPALPATCGICHSSADGEKEFLDFDLQIEYYGNFAICFECAVSCGQAMDMVPVAQLDEALLSLESMQNRLDQKQEENDRLQSTLTSLFILRPELASSSMVNDEESNQGLKDNNPTGEGTKSKSSESDSGK